MTEVDRAFLAGQQPNPQRTCLPPFKDEGDPDRIRGHAERRHPAPTEIDDGRHSGAI
ncbi:hypothetical protein JCM18916_3024 [Cutibacterium acnes JCM 18916]|nr:hypothetical protein JCM18916_3024 [Cutibacterium acnes JCM 18916]